MRTEEDGGGKKRKRNEGKGREKGEGEKEGGGIKEDGEEEKEWRLCDSTKSDNMSLTLRSVVRYARQDPRSPTSL